MKLVIAEKPSVGAEIASVLGANEKKKGYIEGNGYIVSWCIGHLLEMAKPESYDSAYKKWSIDSLPIIPQKWLFETKKNSSKQLEILKELLMRYDVDEVICAADAGREGECIFRYVYRLSGSKKPVKRLWISSVERDEIAKGFEHLRPDSEYDNLYQAGYARTKADWLVGINFSRLFSCLHNEHFNIGRVQTPTLNMIVQRDKQIQNFTSQKYYTITMKCNGITADSDRYDDRFDALKHLAVCNRSMAAIKSVDKEDKAVKPPKLFNLADLQKTANHLLGYTAKETLDIAQELYEKKLITYPRTDSNYITSGMADKMKQLVNLSADIWDMNRSGGNISAVINSEKVIDHHAIIPTVHIEDKETVLNLLPSQFTLLMLICSRLLCSISSAFIYEQTVLNINCGGICFTTKGCKVKDKGYKAIENHCIARLNGKLVEDMDKTLPDILAEGLVLEKTCEVTEHTTIAPKHYTDASLISDMENAGDEKSKGIGTQSTQAGIIEKIIKNGYAVRKGKNIVPTDKGKALIDAVPEEVKSPKMTAEWEEKLKMIECGEYSAKDFTDNITTFVTDTVSKFKEKRHEKE